MNAVLDVLKLRRVKLDYISPPVCPGVSVTSSSGSGMIWVDMGDGGGNGYGGCDFFVPCPPGQVWDPSKCSCIGNQEISTALYACWDSGYFGAIPGLPGDSVSLIGGSLPPGLGLSPDGTISGSPNTPGVFDFAVWVIHLAGGAAINNVSFSVLGVFVAWPPGGGPSIDLPEGTRGEAYSAPISVAGGTAPISFTIHGPAASWLSITDTGYLSGIVPLLTGTTDKVWLFSITATDGLGNSCSTGFSILVRACHWTLQTLPNATPGVAYSQVISAESGTGPFAFAVVSGTLPSGLSLAGDGTVSGVPTTSGTMSFTVNVTDSLGVVCTDDVTITVVPVLYYGLVMTAYYQGNNTPILESGGGFLALPSPVSSGYSVTVHLTGNHPELGGWIRVTGNIGSLIGPVFDTGQIAVPATSIPYPSHYPVTWTAP